MNVYYPDSKGKLNWFTKVIFSIMLIILAFFPFGISAIRMIKGYVGYWDRLTLSVMIVVVGLLLVFCISIMLSIGKKMNRSQVFGTCIGLFTLSMATRILCSYLLQSQPVSDFNTGYQYALGDLTEAPALGDYPYLGAYALTLKALFQLCPHSVLVSQVFNAAVLSLIPVFLFLGVRKIMGNDRPAIAGAILYAMCPSMIVYSSILSCENVSQVFVALFLMIHAYWMSTDLGTKKKYVLSIVLGATMGLINIFKPIMPIFAAAFAMACFCYQLIPAIGAFLHKEVNAGKKVLELVAHLLLVMVVALAFFRVGKYAIQMAILGDTTKSLFSLGSMLYFGLNPETNGVWNTDVIATINEVRELYPNGSDATRLLLQKLADLYQGDISLIWTVQMNKLYLDWCQEAVYYYWTSPTSPIVQGTSVGTFMFEFLPDLFAITLYTFCSIGMVMILIRLFVNKQETPVIGQHMFVCIGSVFLFALMLALIETQGRYKSNIMPYVCCMGGIGMWMIVDSLVKGFNQIKDMATSRMLKRSHT